MSEKIVFKLGEDKLIKFKFDGFFDNLDLDKLLKIDYGNLVAELITSPVILNKMGILNAEVENELRLAKMNFKAREARLRAKTRDRLIEDNKKTTINEVEDALLRDKIYQKYQKEYIEAERNRDYMMSIYMAVRDKSDKLNRLSMSLKSGDIDEQLIQKQLNSLYYKVKNNSNE